MHATRTIVVTGAASGIGAATVALLRAGGARVIGVDLHSADVVADLSTPAGRSAAADQLMSNCNGVLDGLVCAAGVGATGHSAAAVVSTNYFGSVDLYAALLPALQRGDKAAAVMVSSVSATARDWASHPLTGLCLAGDEGAATQAAQALPTNEHYAAYACSKRALMHWVRAQAVRHPSVRLNAIAPGPVDTPLHQAALQDPVLGRAARAFTAPIGHTAQPQEIAPVIGFLLSPGASYVHGAVWFVDGGCDAQLRPTLV